MNILLLSPSYPRSPTDTRVPFIRAFVKELAKEPEINIEVVASSAPDSLPREQLLDNVPIHRFNYFFPRKLQRLAYTGSGGMLESFRSSLLAKLQVPFFILSFFLKARRYAKSSDCIHAQWLLAGLIAVFLKKIYRKPVICEVRGADVRSMPKFLNRFVLRHCDAVVSWTPELTDMLHALGRKENIYDIKGMIDFEKLETTEGVKEFRDEFSLKDKFIVTFLGRLVYMKNPLGFIRAIPFVVEKAKDVVFLVVGDGGLRSQAEALAAQLSIQQYVIFTGNRSDVHAVLRNTSVFVGLSPICHTYSATIMEAMYLGIPVILDQPPYTKENFVHKKYAYLVPNDAPLSLAGAIVELKNNNALRSQLSKNGPSFVKLLGFEKKKIIQQTIELYGKVVGRPKPHDRPH